MVVIGHKTYRLLVGLETCRYYQANKFAWMIHELDDWFAFIQDFLKESALSITLPAVPYLQRKCVRDCALMDLVSERLTRAECRSFNRCRLFLNVTHISDITS